MIVLQVNQIHKSFGAEEIISGAKLEVQHRDRVALVGRNGAGKSTLLKIIAGEMSYDSGDLIMPKDLTIGYLEQQTDLNSDATVWQEMMKIFAHFRDQEAKLRELEAAMANPDVYNDAERNGKVMQEYDLLQTNFKDAGGYQFEADTRAVLHGMKFYPEDYEKKITSLSGGQKTRLMLAKLLLAKPQLLILDEPTNHLDIETLSWLENYLKNYPGALLIVSHDRYFLDQVVTLVYEVSRKKVRKYTGNYSRYLSEKAKQYELDRKHYEKEQGEKAKLEDYVARNLVRASTTKMAQSRRRVLEKTDWMEAPEGDEKSARFGFDILKQSGNDVLNIQSLSVGYHNQAVSNNVALKLYRTESLALVGPNGVGKSTLLKTIMKELPALAGDIHYGTGIQFGYYDQEQANLKGNKLVLNELWDDYPHVNEKDIRGILGRFLFTGDDVLKPVSTLSGGEKARVALSKLMMQKANVLLLDEPTNHLDLDSKEVLENALIDYPGTLLFVSHDRYFMNRIATKVVELSRDGTTEYLGDYDYYVEKKLETEELAALDALEAKAKQPEAQTSSSTSQIDKEAKKLERQLVRKNSEIEQAMESLDEEIAAIEEQLCEPDIFQDHERVMPLQTRLEELKQSHEATMTEWLELQEQLEELNS
ncbi:ABC-F family ATP-binding cassette domain-containing protein [Planococcus sp. CP5-4]|uniref:ABC-F family ATP-binding cassette domain-containing protein n=1 Tax=unclassified Planococcus (in: firmicutes) TaxID=2662419 RepID=UPI001C22EB3A|nr:MULTISPECIES: ABC-F family ATP-binding cassette domain-containing protein [unclassified Planococcus (in: firmicutes)]MBU9674098.1 ABC-F family ATP-binding cassette domain-containing protein [Planococcus sp. CP5-4_YE]MBV0909969.1 ABC-F family ATP-binding cassette domain-containing protein [Planococcus sp. CP5-4_UN]MBW6064849.1 ABC-F family ATP-binding cassette domain-containing protein [Planococcus sp. CP5-4]